MMKRPNISIILNRRGHSCMAKTPTLSAHQRKSFGPIAFAEKRFSNLNDPGLTSLSVSRFFPLETCLSL